MQWPGVNCHEGEILVSARPLHRGNTGGGKPPPPTLPPVRHSGALSVLKRIAQYRSAFQEGGRAETTAFCGGILLSAADDDCPEVILNLMKERDVWRIMSRILIR